MNFTARIVGSCFGTSNSAEHTSGINLRRRNWKSYDDITRTIVVANLGGEKTLFLPQGSLYRIKVAPDH